MSYYEEEVDEVTRAVAESVCDLDWERGCLEHHGARPADATLARMEAGHDSQERFCPIGLASARSFVPMFTAAHGVLCPGDSHTA